MKRIAIITDSMRIGGIEKALTELLDLFDYTKYDVTVFLPEMNGDFVERINANVHIQCWNCKAKSEIGTQLRNFQCKKIIKGCLHRLLTRCYSSNWRKSQYYSAMCWPVFSDINYDCIIAYQINSPAVLVAAIYKLFAAKKVAFYHGKSASPPIDNRFWDKVYTKFDRIFCVSRSSQIEFNSDFPSAAKATTVLNNIINQVRVVNFSNEDLVMEPRAKGFFSLTIGRLSPEKGQQMIPAAARLLVDAGYDIHWYLVGDGPLREEVEREIEKHRVADRVILLGTQTNPYPYIKNCDIYVQPSFSEGWGLTVQEARILQRPIVTTPVPAFSEQIVNGENGLIVDAMTPEALFVGIKTLLDHPEMREKFVNNLKKEDHDNAKELQKLYDFIEGNE